MKKFPNARPYRFDECLLLQIYSKADDLACAAEEYRHDLAKGKANPRFEIRMYVPSFAHKRFLQLLDAYMRKNHGATVTKWSSGGRVTFAQV